MRRRSEEADHTEKEAGDAEEEAGENSIYHSQRDGFTCDELQAAIPIILFGRERVFDLRSMRICYVSVRFGPFRARIEFRHDLLEPSMPEMGDEDLRCSPPFA